MLCLLLVCICSMLTMFRFSILTFDVGYSAAIDFILALLPLALFYQLQMLRWIEKLGISLAIIVAFLYVPLILSLSNPCLNSALLTQHGQPPAPVPAP